MLRPVSGHVLISCGCVLVISMMEKDIALVSAGIDFIFLPLAAVFWI